MISSLFEVVDGTEPAQVVQMTDVAAASGGVFDPLFLSALFGSLGVLWMLYRVLADDIDLQGDGEEFTSRRPAA